MKLLNKFSLWKYLMCRWIRSQKECRKLRRQRDILYDSVKDMAVHWGSYYGDSIGSSRAHYVCEEIRDELNGRT